MKGLGKLHTRKLFLFTGVGDSGATQGLTTSSSAWQACAACRHALHVRGSEQPQVVTRNLTSTEPYVEPPPPAPAEPPSLSEQLLHVRVGAANKNVFAIQDLGFC